MSARGNQPIIYVSGPFYTTGENEFYTAVESVLTGCGFRTYLPHRDGLEGIWLNRVALNAGEEAISALEAASFALEVFQLTHRCSCAVINLNGRVPDEGAVFKGALAFAAGTPVVLYKRDHRTVFFGSDNSMVSGLTAAFRAIDRLSRLPAAVIRAIAGNRPTCRSFCSETVQQGRRLWEYIEAGQGDPGTVMAVIDGSNTDRGR